MSSYAWSHRSVDRSGWSGRSTPRRRPTPSKGPSPPPERSGAGALAHEGQALSIARAEVALRGDERIHQLAPVLDVGETDHVPEFVQHDGLDEGATSRVLQGLAELRGAQRDRSGHVSRGDVRAA